MFVERAVFLLQNKIKKKKAKEITIGVGAWNGGGAITGDVNKTKLLRPRPRPLLTRPRPREVHQQRHLEDLTFTK